MNAPTIQFSVPMKNVGTAYLWWFFFGAIGAHKFYLGRPGMGALYACTLGMFWIGLIWDLFTLPSQVRAANRKMLSDVNSLYGTSPSSTRGFHTDEEPRGAWLANADATIAHYQQERPASSAAAQGNASSPNVAPSFGRRR
jgi:TM2 domain-containing membrane protein YozV